MMLAEKKSFADFNVEIDATICICICTCRRPELLASCLESIAKLVVPVRASIAVAVIDNDQMPSADVVVDKFKNNFPFSLHYRHVYQSGIPFARNAAIELTLELASDYLAFIDDDEWVEPQWLNELHNYSQKVGGDAIISGHVIQELPADVSDTVRRLFGQRILDTGTELSACATNNVLIPMFVMRDLELRFDETHPKMGGEDTMFFTLAAKRGVPIYKCAQAIVHEVIPASRANMRWLSKRKFRVGITAAWRKKQNGRNSVKILVKGVFTVIASLLIALVLAVCLQFELRNKFWLRACKYSGVIVGVFGISIEDYAVIHGK